MQILSIDKVKPGDVLGKSLFNHRGDLLLASGYELTRDMIELMQGRGIRYIHVLTEAAKDINPQQVISDTVRRMANREMSELVESLGECEEEFKHASVEEIKQRIEDSEKLKNVVKMPTVRRVVVKILEEILDNPSVMFSSIRMRAEDGTDYEHAIDTTVLSILIARAFRYSYSDLRTLATAGMLHDIGKVILGPKRRKPPMELNGDEKMILREHPIYSKLILQENAVDTFVEQITMLHHHEQHDGSGYPQGLKGCGRPPVKTRGEDIGYIHRHAEVLAVANVYDNLTTGAYNGRVHSPNDAITALVNGRAGTWNPYVVRALVKCVECFPVGITVRIVDNYSKRFLGYRGIVAKSNSEDQSKPSIILTHNTTGTEIVPRLIDFSDEKFMEIEIELWRRVMARRVSRRHLPADSARQSLAFPASAPAVLYIP